MTSGKYKGEVNWDSYVCHSCRKQNKSSFSSKTTLVAVPPHIALQLIDEIKKHISPGKKDWEYSEKGIVMGRRNGVSYLLYPGFRAIQKAIYNSHGRINYI